MLTIALSEIAWGAAMLATAMFFGQWLFRLSRRAPSSVLVNNSLLADFICVGEVMLLVLGLMLFTRGLALAL